MNIKDAGLIFIAELRNSTLITLCRSRDMTKMQVLSSPCFFTLVSGNCSFFLLKWPPNVARAQSITSTVVSAWGKELFSLLGLAKMFANRPFCLKLCP